MQNKMNMENKTYKCVPENSQINLSAQEIEKKIKELSEKELQDEKVIIDILRKCFEDKEDIVSMIEGDNLELLAEKVMELVIEVYV